MCSAPLFAAYLRGVRRTILRTDREVHFRPVYLPAVRKILNLEKEGQCIHLQIFRELQQTTKVPRSLYLKDTCVHWRTDPMFRLLSISCETSAVNRGAISAIYPTELDLGSCFKMMRTNLADRFFRLRAGRVRNCPHCFQKCLLCRLDPNPLPLFPLQCFA